MVDESGKEYDIRVYSTPLRGLSGTSKIYDFWWGDEVVNCLELGDHIPIRSLPYFKARRLLSTLLIPVTSPPAP